MQENPPPAPPALAHTLERLAAVIESRKGADPASSYVARLLHGGPDAFLKKIGEEAAEVVMAAKDAEHGAGSAEADKLVAEMADLWFHSLVALAHFGRGPQHVLAELARREGVGGLQEKAARAGRSDPCSGGGAR